MKIRIIITLSIISMLTACSPEKIRNQLQNIHNQSITNKEKVRLSILGGAIGDAMGRPTEFIMTTEKILQEYPGGLCDFRDFKIKDFLLKDGKKVAPYTDDTAMAKITLETLIKARKNNWSLEEAMDNLAKEFVVGMNQKDGWAAPHRAPGNCCLKNCKKLESIIKAKQTDKKYWWRVSQSQDGGCGSVMRAHPFGLVFADNPQKAEKWAVEHSKITHAAPLAIASCAAMAVGTAYALQGQSPEYIIKKMINTAKRYDTQTADMIKDAHKLAVENKKACQNYNQMFEKSKPVFKKYLGWAGHDAIAATVYILALAPDNAKDAIALGVNTPGDSDSIASMAGALIGARGKRFAKEWIEIIEGSKNLQTLADEVDFLLTKDMAKESSPPK